MADSFTGLKIERSECDGHIQDDLTTGGQSLRMATCNGSCVAALLISDPTGSEVPNFTIEQLGV